MAKGSMAGSVMRLSISPGEDGAAYYLGRISALHEGKHPNAGGKAVNVDALVAGQFEHTIDEVGAGEIEEQDEHQLRYGAHQRGVEFEQVPDHRPAIELAVGAGDSNQHTDAEGANCDQDGVEQSTQKIAGPTGRTESQQVENARLRQL
jgi:hypothetical protein